MKLDIDEDTLQRIREFFDYVSYMESLEKDEDKLNKALGEQLRLYDKEFSKLCKAIDNQCSGVY